MKKTTLFLAISLTMLLGCSKKDANLPTTPAAPAQGTNATFYKVNLNDNGTNTVSTVSVPYASLRSLTAAPTTPHHAMGNWTLAPGGPTSLTDNSNVVSNAGGIHGHISWTGRFGVEMDAVCLQIVGNAAICSGVITSVSYDAGFPGVFAVGNIILFAVIDNGEGANAAPDQVNNALFYWTPASGPFPCGADFSQLPWSSQNNNILPGGQIQVK